MLLQIPAATLIALLHTPISRIISETLTCMSKCIHHREVNNLAQLQTYLLIFVCI